MNTYIHAYFKLEENTVQNFSRSHTGADKHSLIQVMHPAIDHQTGFQNWAEHKIIWSSYLRLPDPSRDRDDSLALNVHPSHPFLSHGIHGSLEKKATFPACLAHSHITQVCLLEMASVICGRHSHGKACVFLWLFLSPAAQTQWAQLASWTAGST